MHSMRRLRTKTKKKGKNDFFFICCYSLIHPIKCLCVIGYANVWAKVIVCASVLSQTCSAFHLFISSNSPKFCWTCFLHFFSCYEVVVLHLFFCEYVQQNGHGDIKALNHQLYISIGVRASESQSKSCILDSTHRPRDRSLKRQ